MKNMKFWRTALVATLVLTVMLSVTGGTIAWFTDEVTSANNLIEAGKLDVELGYSNKSETGTVDANTELFKVPALWEPGAAAYEKLTVMNAGNLALKYELAINATGENNLDGKVLSEVLKVGVPTTDLAVTASREEVVAAVTEWKDFTAFSVTGDLLQNESDEYGVVIYWMPTANDNDWNANNGKLTSDGEPLHINLGVKLSATQLMAEEDSFGSDYDKDAHWVDTNWYTSDATTYTIKTFEELAGLAQIVNGTGEVHDSFEDKTVYLGADIDMKNVDWTPIGRIDTSATDFNYAFKGTFDGQEYTVSNLNVSNEGWAGLFGLAYKADIKNVNIKNVTINSNRMAGSVVGQLYGNIENCQVNNAEIIVVPNAVGDSYDNGDKVGGIVGWIGDKNNNRELKNCSAKDVTIKAYRDMGGIAGFVAASTKVTDNSASGITLYLDQYTNYYGDEDFNAGLIYGRKNGTITEANNNATGEVVLYAVPSEYASETYTVPEGVTTIDSYAFAYNDNIEKIVLPTTVTTLNDRAFRDTSASEVVLNEGLTNISYQAFRNASNVTSVTIPSTVTTISKEAFQLSGIKTLTIPAGVTTIEYGACRDMQNLETVIIEGNVKIPAYAFRACTKLRTVVLKGNDVTFDAGHIFTNYETGDGSAITVYVANENVKERLLAADAAATSYGGYTIVVGMPQ